MHAEHEHTEEGPKVFGVIAEFDDPDDVVKAAQRAYDHGYRKMDAYTPFPVHGLAEAVGYRKNLVAPLVLCGGLDGAADRLRLRRTSRAPGTTRTTSADGP